MQIIFTPHLLYKIFRQLVVGYSAGAEPSGYYIDSSIVPTTLAKLKATYFKFGTGADKVGGVVQPLVRDWFDANIKDEAAGKGDVKSALRLYATDPEGYTDKYTKELVAADFYNYGASAGSKVIGVESVSVDPLDTSYWNVAGVMFQVGCHLALSEGNYDAAGVALVPPATVAVNEIGIFDDDDVLILYGTFLDQTKSAESTLKCNSVAMIKALDYQLVFVP